MVCCFCVFGWSMGQFVSDFQLVCLATVFLFLSGTSSGPSVAELVTPWGVSPVNLSTLVNSEHSVISLQCRGTPLWKTYNEVLCSILSA